MIQIKSIYGKVLFEYEGADLRGADLRESNLFGANLREANLFGTNLRGADLRGADLCEANLREANLYGHELTIARTRILPEGDIIGYKKCENNIIVKLLIPKQAKRSHAFGRKCRAEYAEILEIYGADEAFSKWDNEFVYKVGEVVKPKEPFSEDWTDECASGIHFFISRIEAENY
ncbi:MAG: DUF5758 domain-containing protein [Sphingobacterium sp.]